MFRARKTVFLCGLVFLNLAVTAHAAGAVVAVADATGAPVADAVVWFPAQTPERTADRAVVDQIDKQFVPQVTVVSAGTEVAFPNSDSVSHHVYSFAQPNSFELPLYRGGETPVVRFDHPGIVTLGCNIHDSMLGYIVVLDGAEFAVTDAGGLAHFKRLPAEDSEIKIWSPQLDVAQAVTAERIATTDTRLSVRAAVELQPLPDVREGSLAWEDY